MNTITAAENSDSTFIQSRCKNRGTGIFRVNVYIPSLISGEPGTPDKSQSFLPYWVQSGSHVQEIASSVGDVGDGIAMAESYHPIAMACFSIIYGLSSYFFFDEGVTVNKSSLASNVALDVCPLTATPAIATDILISRLQSTGLSTTFIAADTWFVQSSSGIFTGVTSNELYIWTQVFHQNRSGTTTIDADTRTGITNVTTDFPAFRQNFTVRDAAKYGTWPPAGSGEVPRLCGLTLT